MASVRVRVDDLERGDLPALSAKSGTACANPVAIVLRPEQRPWSPLGPRVDAVVPLEARRVRGRRVLARVSWAALVAGAAALVAAFTGGGSAAAVLVLVAVAAYGVLVTVGELRWIGARPSGEAGEIVLTRVHPAFARAVDEQYGRRPQP
jgi:hypothetical protein